jgi:hypothetical protein
MVKKVLPLISVFLVALFATWPLLTPGFIPTHDGEYHIIRFFEFDKNIKAGEFFPRWAPGLNSGFGVPLFNFFYPLPNYIGAFFHLLGFSFIDSFKLTLAAGVIIGGLFSCLWIKEIFGAWAGAVGAVFYTLAPYHLVDVYIRGSVGEVWALALFPAVLWLVEKKSLFAGVFLALLILSHNILALIFLPFLISYLIFRKFTIYYLLFTICVALGLSCFFWLPALVEAKYVTGLRTVNFADHFPALAQLLFPSWGSGFSVPGILDQMSFQIGIPHLLVVLFAFLLLFLKERKGKIYLFFFLIWFLVIFTLLLEISLPLWKLIPVMPFFQYPWRFLSLIILFASFLSGSFVLYQKQSKILALVLVFLALAFYAGYTRPVKYPPRTDDFYLTNPIWTDGTNTLGDSFATIWAPGKQPQRAKEKLTIVQGEAGVKNLFIKPTSYSFQVETATPAELQANTVYFPGWKVFVDDEETPINFENGLINFQIPEGKHIIEVEFRDTLIRTLVNRISFLSLLFLFGAGIFLRKKARER